MRFGILVAILTLGCTLASITPHPLVRDLTKGENPSNYSPVPPRVPVPPLPSSRPANSLLSPPTPHLQSPHHPPNPNKSSKGPQPRQENNSGTRRMNKQKVDPTTGVGVASVRTASHTQDPSIKPKEPAVDTKAIIFAIGASVGGLACCFCCILTTIKVAESWYLNKVRDKSKHGPSAGGDNDRAPLTEFWIPSAAEPKKKMAFFGIGTRSSVGGYPTDSKAPLVQKAVHISSPTESIPTDVCLDLDRPRLKVVPLSTKAPLAKDRMYQPNSARSKRIPTLVPVEAPLPSHPGPLDPRPQRADPHKGYAHRGLIRTKAISVPIL